MNAPPKSATGFWSIERAVAFVIGPIVTTGSTWVSLWLGKHVPGIEVPAEAIYAQSGAVALGVGGLFYKWLHGRQVETQVKGAVAQAEQIPGVGGFIHTTLHDLEGLAQHAAATAVQAIHPAANSQGEPKTAAAPAAVSVQADQPPPEPPIPPAAGDPAPATPASDQSGADAGAAPVE